MFWSSPYCILDINQTKESSVFRGVFYSAGRRVCSVAPLISAISHGNRRSKF